MNRLYHVYIDRKPDGSPFYVGIGNTARIRCSQRNNWHKAVRKKYPDWTRSVVETATRMLCEELESLLIKEIGRRDLGLGPLVNLTDGGEGAPNALVSEETRRRQSSASRGRKKSAEHAAKIAAALTGIKRSDESKKKMSAAKLGKALQPEHAAKIGEASRAHWRNQEYRNSVSSAVRAAWQREDIRAQQSACVKLRMQDPAAVEKMAMKVRESWENPKLLAEASARTKGTIWMSRAGETLRIKIDSVPDFERLGWKRGRK